MEGAKSRRPDILAYGRVKQQTELSLILDSELFLRISLGISNIGSFQSIDTQIHFKTLII